MLLMRHTNWKKANFGVFNATELCFLGSNWWGGPLRSNKTFISSRNWYTAEWLPRCLKKGCQFYSKLLFFWLALKCSWDIRIVNATTSATNSWDTWRFVGGDHSPPSNVEKNSLPLHAENTKFCTLFNIAFGGEDGKVSQDNCPRL